MFNIKAGTEYEDETANLQSINKFLLSIMYFLAGIVVVLLVGYFNLREVTNVKVEIPPIIYSTDKGVVIEKGIAKANDEYYKVWGSYLVRDISNFNENNIGKKVGYLLKKMKPSVALKYDDKLSKYAELVVKNKVSQNFEILKEEFVDIDDREKQIIYKGVAKKTVSEKDAVSKECKYIINLKLYKSGVLYVEEFGTDCL